jgi:hypothetical protein
MAPAGPKVSSRRVSVSAIVAAAIGTLSQKIHSQAMPSEIAPPTTGPLSTARPVTPLKIPSALARLSGGKAALSCVRASGITSAAPAPCTPRAAISQPGSGASAHAADAAANRVSPAVNMRRRPKRSPSAAPVISSTAKLRLYALTVHSSCSIEAARSSRIVGSAVETTSESRETMNDAIDVSASTHRRAAVAVPGVASVLTSSSVHGRGLLTGADTAAGKNWAAAQFWSPTGS